MYKIVHVALYCSSAIIVSACARETVAPATVAQDRTVPSAFSTSNDLRPSPSPIPLVVTPVGRASLVAVHAANPTTYDECQGYAYDWCAIPTGAVVKFTAPGHASGDTLQVKIDAVPAGWSIQLESSTIACGSDSCPIVFDASALSTATIGLLNLTWEDCAVQKDGTCKAIFQIPFNDPVQVSCNVTQTLPQPCPLGQVYDDYAKVALPATGNSSSVGLAQQFTYQKDPKSGVAGASYVVNAANSSWVIDGDLVTSYDVNSGVAPPIISQQIQNKVATTTPFYWWQDSPGPYTRNIGVGAEQFTRAITSSYTEKTDEPSIQSSFTVKATGLKPMSASLANVTLSTNTAPEPGQTLALGVVTHSEDSYDVSTAGITFDYSLAAPQAGTIGVVQLLNGTCKLEQTTGSNRYFDAGTTPILDVLGSQTTTPFYGGITTASGSSDQAIDAPNSNLANEFGDGSTTTVTRGDQFNDVLMYEPTDTRPNKGQSIWVPAESRTWFWNGTAFRPANPPPSPAPSPSGLFTLYSPTDRGQASNTLVNPPAPTWVSRVVTLESDSYCVPEGGP